MPPRLLVLDPLTLVGRELLGCLEQPGRVAPDLEFRHTNAESEHQIADVGGQPVLVPPLDSASDLEGYELLVVASDAWGSRHELLVEFIDNHTDAAVLDLSRLEGLRELTVPATGSSDPLPRRARIAHPALVAATRAAEVLEPFGLLGATLAVIDPVSEHGREAVELLARQAARRLQGGAVEDLIYGHVRAFNLVAVEPSHLQEDASHLLPELSIAVTHCLSGMFHGHLAHLGLACNQRLEPHVVADALAQAERLEIVDFPLNLDSVADADSVLVSAPVVSADGRLVALTLMADGLRVGGALTALDILDGLI